MADTIVEALRQHASEEANKSDATGYPLHVYHSAQRIESLIRYGETGRVEGAASAWRGKLLGILTPELLPDDKDSIETSFETGTPLRLNDGTYALFEQKPPPAHEAHLSAGPTEDEDAPRGFYDMHVEVVGQSSEA